MTAHPKFTLSDLNVSTMDAIHNRRSVRDYKNGKIEKASIGLLLDAAVHAPTAVHEEPWAFVIIQDKKVLNRISDRAKELLVSGADAIHPLRGSHAPHSFT